MRRRAASGERVHTHRRAELPAGAVLVAAEADFDEEDLLERRVSGERRFQVRLAPLVRPAPQQDVRRVAEGERGRGVGRCRRRLAHQNGPPSLALAAWPRRPRGAFARGGGAAPRRTARRRAAVKPNRANTLAMVCLLLKTPTEAAGGALRLPPRRRVLRRRCCSTPTRTAQAVLRLTWRNRAADTRGAYDRPTARPRRSSTRYAERTRARRRADAGCPTAATLRHARSRSRPQPAAEKAAARKRRRDEQQPRWPAPR